MQVISTKPHAQIAVFGRSSSVLTDGRTDGRTDGWTDRPCDRDAKTHLKVKKRATETGKMEKGKPNGVQEKNNWLRLVGNARCQIKQ